MSAKSACEEWSMASPEFDELKEMIGRVEGKVNTIATSLKSCQSHCYVDNPKSSKSRWKSFFQAITAFFRIG
jgi:hypothetical protein